MAINFANPDQAPQFFADLKTIQSVLGSLDKDPAIREQQLAHPKIQQALAVARSSGFLDEATKRGFTGFDPNSDVQAQAQALLGANRFLDGFNEVRSRAQGAGISGFDPETVTFSQLEQLISGGGNSGAFNQTNASDFKSFQESVTPLQPERATKPAPASGITAKDRARINQQREAQGLPRLSGVEINQLYGISPRPSGGVGGSVAGASTQPAFQYVKKDGTLGTIFANSAQEAMARMPADANPNSGVMAVNVPSSRGQVAGASTVNAQLGGGLSGGLSGGFSNLTGGRADFTPFRLSLPDIAPSSALQGSTSLNDLMSKAMEAFRSNQKLQEQFLASLAPSEDELRVQDELRRLNQGERLGLEKIESETIPLEFIVGQQRELKRQTALERLAASENLQALVSRRQSKTDALKSALGFGQDNLETLLGLDSHFRKIDKEDRGIVRDQLTDIIAFAEGRRYEDLDRQSQQVIQELASRSPGMTIGLIQTALERGALAFEDDRALSAEKLASQQALTDQRLSKISSGSSSSGYSSEAQYYIDAILNGVISVDDNLSQIPQDVRGEVLNALIGSSPTSSTVGNDWNSFRSSLVPVINQVLAAGGGDGVLSASEANQLGLPSSMVGMRESDLVQQLLSSNAPSWFGGSGGSALTSSTPSSSGSVNLF